MNTLKDNLTPAMKSLWQKPILKHPSFRLSAMVVRTALVAMVAGLSLSLLHSAKAQPQPASQSQEKPNRGFKIIVSATAPEIVRHAAQQVLDAAKGPAPPRLLGVMSAGNAPHELTDSQPLLAAKVGERAYNHLILVGLPNDAMIGAAWQREARPEDGGFYVFGWGHLHGDIGYIESDRNPFLHSATIPTAPFETEIVTLTGNTPAGVALAVEAFLKRGLVNGVVAAPGWTRPQTTILDHDPLPSNFAPPSWLPANAGGANLVGWSAGGEDEYRGVLQDTSVQPVEIWRAKYYRDGAWDGAGVTGAFDAYSAGLHRRAYGNTLWIARFASAQQAAQSAPRIAAAAKLNQKGELWEGVQPPYADGKNVGEKPSSGALRLWQRGDWLLMSTLPPSETDDLIAHMKEAP